MAPAAAQQMEPVMFSKAVARGSLRLMSIWLEIWDTIMRSSIYIRDIRASAIAQKEVSGGGEGG